MTLTIVFGEPGGPQRRVLRDAANGNTLWIAVDQLPPANVGLYDLWVDTPWEALAAAAARLGRGPVDVKDLLISTLNGFNGPTIRPVQASDHTPWTLALCKQAIRGDPLPGRIIIAGLSTMYERALAVVSGSLSNADLEKASELVPAFAGSALTHWLWDLQRAGIPILADAWEVPQGKKQVPYIPKGVSNIADRVIRHDAFDLLKTEGLRPHGEEAGGLQPSKGVVP